MKSNKQKSGSSTSRGKVFTSIVTTALGVVASLISSIVATADVLKVSKEWGLSIAAAATAVAISAVFTSMIARRERGTSRTAKLKEDLSSAYLGALDASSLNPFRGGSK
jgi:predicted cation transporter